MTDLYPFVYQVLVSGGVDSTVCAALLRHALREDQVIALHIDNGMSNNTYNYSYTKYSLCLGVAESCPRYQYQLVLVHSQSQEPLLVSKSFIFC